MLSKIGSSTGSDTLLALAIVSKAQEDGILSACLRGALRGPAMVMDQPN